MAGDPLEWLERMIPPSHEATCDVREAMDRAARCPPGSELDDEDRISCLDCDHLPCPKLKAWCEADRALMEAARKARGEE